MQASPTPRSRVTAWIPTLSMLLVSLISYIDRNTLALLAPTILRETSLTAGLFDRVHGRQSHMGHCARPVWIAVRYVRSGCVLDRSLGRTRLGSGFPQLCLRARTSGIWRGRDVSRRSANGGSDAPAGQTFARNRHRLQRRIVRGYRNSYHRDADRSGIRMARRISVHRADRGHMALAVVLRQPSASAARAGTKG
jgi:hypothetical protein